MWMFPILILLTVFFARCISTYDITLIFKKHIIIKNSNVAKILIDQSRVNSRAKLLKANRNKLTVSGLIFYTAILLFTLTSIILLFFVSPIGSQPYIIDSRFLYLYAETLNQKISVCLFEYLLFAEVVFYFFNIHRSFTPKMRKKAEEKLQESDK